MINEESSPELVQLARALGVVSDDPFRGTVAKCLAMVNSWVEQCGGIGPSGISGAADLQALVANRLALAIEEIHAEQDFDRLAEFYARERGEFVFAGLRARFDDEDDQAFGALIRRRNASCDAKDKFVAVVDCRGEKHARRYFTRWHEIAHRLTTHCDQLEGQWEYSCETIEVLMDAIASELGFYEPFLKPAIENVRGSQNWCTFGMIERIIESVFPEASFQSTLFACMRISKLPMVYVELGGEPLRFFKIIPNQVAQLDGLLYSSSQRHPSESVEESEIPRTKTRLVIGAEPSEGSVFHRVLERGLLSDEIEHLSMDLLAMRDVASDRANGRPIATREDLREMLTHVEARRVPGKVIGLLQY
jgi:hypothetical protein